MDAPVENATEASVGVVLTRRDKILTGLDVSNLAGLEIGPLAAPLVRKSDGDIFYVDHADSDSLRAKYLNDPGVNIDNIVNVDGVWGNQSLQECLGYRHVDYVVASHVIEHVPDLVTWLNEIHSVLRPAGSLRLAVPDKQYTFDYLRFETRIHDVLDAYLRRARAPLPRMIIEHFGFTRIVNLQHAWEGTIDPASLQPFTTLKDAVNIAQAAHADGSYHDCHCWVFTPLSFAELFVHMAELELLGFECENFIDTAFAEFEFYVHLRPSEDRPKILKSWQNMVASLA